MQDNFHREINYLRIAVTDRCNLRCRYCMPQEGIKLKPHREILSFEEIVAVVKVAVAEFGFKKIRLTGGEPLVRRGIVNLVEQLAAIEGITDLAMTSNGILLEQYAQPLANAGLKRVNISLDTLDPERFAAITRGGELEATLRGIEAALAASLTPVKINCVVHHSSAEVDAQAIQKYAYAKGLTVRFIRQMNFAKGEFSKIIGGEAGECACCNRLRLLSDGKILPCLFSDKTFSVRELGIATALTEAIKYKPERGTPCLTRWMAEIGG